MAESSGTVKQNATVGIAIIDEALAELRRKRPSCTEKHARERIQIGRDVQSDEVVRLWRCVLARIVEARAWS